jgi:hypothetical protein
MIHLLLLGFIVFGGWAWRDYASSAARFDGTDEGKAKAMSHILRVMRDTGITPAELAKAWDDPTAMAPARRKREAGEIAMKVFSWLGGIFILGGVGTYVEMFWPTMSSAFRIFITLGFGLGLSVLACIAMKEGKYPRIVLPLIVAAAVIETGGWSVFVDEIFPHTGDLRKAAIFITGIMLLQEWLTYGIFRRTSLFFFAVLFSYGFIESSLGELGMREEFICMLLGGSLFCVSHWTLKTPHRALTEIGYFFAGLWFNAGLYDFIGTNLGWPQAAIVTGLSICSLGYGMAQVGAQRLSALGFLIGSAAFYAGLFDWVRHTPYELLYLAAAVAMMYGHSVLESQAILLTSTLAILGFIGYYTEEHFVNSVGWPVALVLLGVAFFAVGAMAVRIKRRAS